jgi:hypothetical protein
MLITRLSTQGYNNEQSCYIKHVTDFSEQPCNKSDNFDKVVTSCQQVVPNLLTICDKQCEYILLTDCEQTCNKLVRFYVCNTLFFQYTKRLIKQLNVQFMIKIMVLAHIPARFALSKVFVVAVVFILNPM